MLLVKFGSLSINTDYFPSLMPEVLKRHDFLLPCRNQWGLLEDSGLMYSRVEVSCCSFRKSLCNVKCLFLQKRW